MSFDFSKWASQSLAKIEGTLDQAFGLESSETQQSNLNASLSTPPELLISENEQKDASPVNKMASSIEPRPSQKSTRHAAEYVTENGSAVTQPQETDLAKENLANSDVVPATNLDVSSNFVSTVQENHLKAQNDELTLLKAENALRQQLSAAVSLSNSTKEDNLMHIELQKTKSQLQDLLLEGEKWSKKQLKLENIVKTLRKEVACKNAELLKVQQDVESKSHDVDSLKEKIRFYENSERDFVEKISALTSQLHEKHSEIEKLSRESVLLDKESVESIAVTERLEAKLKAQQVEAAHWKVAFDEQKELHQRIVVMQDQLKEGELREQALRRNIVELSGEVQTLREDSDEEKRQLRYQLQQAREQLNDSLCQNEHLRREIPLSTHPLLKQIETLQNSLKLQRERFESEESKLLAKLESSQRDLEKRLRSIQSSENHLNESKQAQETLQSELEFVQKQNEKLTLKTEELKKTIEELSSSLVSKEEHCGSLQSRLVKAEHLAQEALEKYELEVSQTKREMVDAQSKLRDAQAALTQLQSVSAKSADISESFGNRYTDVRRQRSREFDINNEASEPSEKPASVLIYDLSTQLRRQEAELLSLRGRLSDVEANRDALSEQLLLASFNSKSESEKAMHLREQLETLKMRHEIALNIIGEKTDELDELNADLKECKAIFKEQLEVMTQELQIARMKNKE